MSAETIEGAIAAKLVATSAVNAIIFGRIHPAGDPTVYARPKLYYQRVSGSRNYSNDGPIQLRQVRLTITASADDPLTAKQLAQAVDAALDGFAGVLSGIEVGCIRVDDVADETIPTDTLGKPRPAQRVRVELIVDYYA